MSSSAFATGSLITLPAGSMIDYAGTSAPEGWLMCDGGEYLKTAYPQLAAALLSNGTFPYGETNGSGGAGTTHFRVPDFRGRFARYNDNMGTARGAAGRDSGRTHGTTQTQSTAKNGLTASSSGIAGYSGLTNPAFDYSNFSGSGPGDRAVNYGWTTAGTNYYSSHTHTITLNDPTGAETRPINLSCNRIIKI